MSLLEQYTVLRLVIEYAGAMVSWKTMVDEVLVEADSSLGLREVANVDS